MTKDKCLCEEINARHCPVHNEPEPREWLYIGNFISRSGEKYTILNGPDIGDKKVWLVEKSAYEALKTEIELLKGQCHVTRSAYDELKTALKVVYDLSLLGSNSISIEVSRMCIEILQRHELANE